LQRVFERWGLPHQLRVDNGYPWGSHGLDLPSPLTLWLTGLGIDVQFNPPRTPTANGLVERVQGLLQNWAEVTRCPSFQQLQGNLDWAVALQRESYTSERLSQTRLTAHPHLLTPLRPYVREQETHLWQVSRVWALLRDRQWVRRVDKVGRISWYGRGYTIQRSFARQQVYLHLDPEHAQWVVSSEQGEEIKRWSAADILPFHLLPPGLNLLGASSPGEA
jgi:hypothetical protein